VPELEQRLRDGDLDSLREFLADEYFSCTPLPGEPTAPVMLTG
jgi:hypothetical protein